ncbi:MAG TPA: M56 family metallopeptidase, partial [Silvibacterium sp.]|nr:M56 family metallopeptidase [Silvibacterium sp.]
MTNAIEIPGWEALGWTLIHFCWQAAAIALLYRMIDLALPRARSNVRYVVALTALLSMLAVSVATLGYEEMRGAQDKTTWRDTVSVTGVGETFAVLPVADNGGARLSEPASVWAGLESGIQPVIPWLVAIWLLGVFCLSVRTVGGWWMIQRLRRASMGRAPESVRESFARLSLRIGIRRPIDLRVCERISSPMAMGIVRSLVLLPASALTSLSPEQLEVVLAHELAHIRRADYLWNML